MNPELIKWAESATNYFAKAGLNRKWAFKAALLYVTAYVQGFDPRITSLWRDPEKQKALVERWERGDRAGFIGKPAKESKHTITSFLGVPMAEAMDMPSNNIPGVDALAKALGIGYGSGFSSPDPGHYFFIG